MSSVSGCGPRTEAVSEEEEAIGGISGMKGHGGETFDIAGWVEDLFGKIQEQSLVGRGQVGDRPNPPALLDHKKAVRFTQRRAQRDWRAEGQISERVLQCEAEALRRL